MGRIFFVEATWPAVKFPSGNASESLLTALKSLRMFCMLAFTKAQQQEALKKWYWLVANWKVNSHTTPKFYKMAPGPTLLTLNRLGSSTCSITWLIYNRIMTFLSKNRQPITLKINETTVLVIGGGGYEKKMRFFDFEGRQWGDDITMLAPRGSFSSAIRVHIPLSRSWSCWFDIYCNQYIFTERWCLETDIKYVFTENILSTRLANSAKCMRLCEQSTHSEETYCVYWTFEVSNQLCTLMKKRHLLDAEYSPDFVSGTNTCPQATDVCKYSQNHVKCSRPLCSLPGLQGQKFFADAIINFLIPFKSVSDENSYDQLFINEVVKIFTFQFDESVIKFYLVKVFQILMKFW